MQEPHWSYIFQSWLNHLIQADSLYHHPYHGLPRMIYEELLCLKILPLFLWEQVGWEYITYLFFFFIISSLAIPSWSSDFFVQFQNCTFLKVIFCFFFWYNYENCLLLAALCRPHRPPLFVLPLHHQQTSVVIFTSSTMSFM